MQKYSDFSLVQRVTVFHDKHAFDMLVVKYQSSIRRFLLAQTHGDEALSDDLAQDTFIKAYTRLHQFKGQSQFSTWLFRIAYNVFYDYIRRKKITENIDTAAVKQKHAPNENTYIKLDLYDALEILTEQERICITLQLIEGKAIDKIAEITGLANGTVKSHLFRGKQKLTNYLKQNGYDGKR